MKVILGIGNPGLRYKFSRHNLGFSVVERLAQKNRLKIRRKNFNYSYAQTNLGAEPLLLVKPETFVNLSGRVVSLLVREKEIAARDLLVVCDDINLPLGKMRIKASGSAGGHRGLRSIIQALATKDFSRLRIGVGQPEAAAESSGRGAKLTRHVLGRFNKQEARIITQAVEAACACCQAWFERGINAAMNEFN
ncbi:aminoacyl-tRNA hydrolase [Candidatus Omnitrophota bacterium]